MGDYHHNVYQQSESKFININIHRYIDIRSINTRNTTLARKNVIPIKLYAHNFSQVVHRRYVFVCVHIPIVYLRNLRQISQVSFIVFNSSFFQFISSFKNHIFLTNQTEINSTRIGITRKRILITFELFVPL